MKNHCPRNKREKKKTEGIFFLNSGQFFFKFEENIHQRIQETE